MRSEVPAAAECAFGPVAIGREHEGSDIDLLFHMDEPTGLADLSHPEPGLEVILGVDVNAVPDSALTPFMESRVMSEAVPLWLLRAELPKRSSTKHRSFLPRAAGTARDAAVTDPLRHGTARDMVRAGFRQPSRCLDTSRASQKSCARARPRPAEHLRTAANGEPHMGEKGIRK
ncbi:nucleotidyltransferase domain-containing protein [Actinomyces israelii]|uniref:Nucleotidyltransferase domain-containing protein n=1 Tax=Actinomyces israelii TaxID=1659 RepID=A0ABT4I7J8_9ACTO|nr:nucleotidyltransferase domain-containing protein [Actinomyces israelii]MCZ0857717.1 nucleotidyltransferase domain-containing protein [Actinomyces israelii]